MMMLQMYASAAVFAFVLVVEMQLVGIYPEGTGGCTSVFTKYGPPQARGGGGGLGGGGVACAAEG